MARYQQVDPTMNMGIKMMQEFGFCCKCCRRSSCNARNSFMMLGRPQDAVTRPVSSSSLQVSCLGQQITH